MPVIGSFAVPHPPLIVPKVGRGEEKMIKPTVEAYQEAARRCAALKPDVLIVLSPHSILYYDYFHISPRSSASGSFAAFGVPDVRFDVKYDTELVDAIAHEASVDGIAAGTLGERDRTLDHGTMIPLYFFQPLLPDVPIVRIGLSGFSLVEHYRFGKAIARAVDSLGRRAVIIASGDLSHRLKADGPYGFAAEGPEFDRRIMEIFASGDFGQLLRFDPTFCEAAAECGLRSFVIMAGAYDGRKVLCDALSHQDTFGVGYGVACFLPGEPDESRHFDVEFLAEERVRLDAIAAKEDLYVRLARASLEAYVTTGRRMSLPSGLPDELTSRRAGAFVSIKKDGQLRGCIGTIEPTRPTLAEEIIGNAVSAGMNDPRFPSVRKDELPWLVYDVDVLNPAEPARREDLDPKRYGVIVRSGMKCGLLLPNLDGVDTVDQQISIAMKKAGIRPSDHYTLERFEVVRHL